MNDQVCIVSVYKIFPSRIMLETPAKKQGDEGKDEGRDEGRETREDG